MVKWFGNSKKESDGLKTSIGPDIAKFEEALIYYGAMKKFEEGSLSQEDIEIIKQDIRHENGKKYKSSTETVSDKNPDCKKVKMKFSNGLEFICFGKRAEKQEIEKEKCISEYFKTCPVKITTSPIYSNSHFIAFDLLDPDEATGEVTITKKLPSMNADEKYSMVEKITDKIAAYNSMALDNKIKKMLTKNNYLKEYKHWGFAKDLDYKGIAKILNEHSTGIIENGIHPDNIVPEKNGNVMIIDWAESMYGCPQSDLARTVLSFELEDTDKEDRAVESLYSKLHEKGKAESFDEFKQVYKLARIHEYFKLAQDGEDLIKRYNKLLSANKNKLTPAEKESYANHINKAKEGRDIFLKNALNYSALNGIYLQNGKKH